MRVVRSAPRAWPHRRDRHRGGARAARRVRGVDRGRHRRRAADRFPRGPHSGARALSPAGAGGRRRALCRRAGRRGVRGRPVCRRGRRRSRQRSRSRSCRPLLDSAGAAGRVRAGPQHRGGAHPPGLRRRRRACSARRMHVVELELAHRPPFRRAAGDARRHRPLRRRARRSRAARRRQGAAPQPRTAGAHARPAADLDPGLRRHMSAAASASAASSIPRMCWSASRRCGSSAR